MNWAAGNPCVGIWGLCPVSCAFSPISSLTCDPIHFPHDELGSHGFLVDGFGYRIGYATDTRPRPFVLL